MNSEWIDGHFEIEDQTLTPFENGLHVTYPNCPPTAHGWNALVGP